jgi:DNA polymerase I-like protein with 3'-5' exonuclease and polymerase domains
MELRLAAAVAKDPVMTKAFQDGADLHSLTAEIIGCDRQVAKSANFGLLYGSGATGLRNYAGAMGITMSMDEAKKIREDWLSAYPGIAQWQRDHAAAADQPLRGGANASIRIPISNFRRFLPGDMNRLTVRANSPIQGAGAAVLKVALGNLWPLVRDAGPDEVRIAASLHDEIICLAREEHAEKWRAILQETMEAAEALWLGDIPAVAEAHIGKRWSEVH